MTLGLVSQAVHTSALVAENVVLGAFCSIAADARIGAGSVLREHVVVGSGAIVGRGCILQPHVVLYPGVSLGDCCEVHSGTVIGADCYGHEDEGQGVVKILRGGSVNVGNNVEIGANCSIQRGQHRDTVLGDHVKIGDLSVIAHDCRIGRRTRLIGQVGLASNVTIGEDVMLMGQVGVRAGVTIGDRVVVFAKSGVFGDLPADDQYLGYPARRHRDALRAMALVRQVPRLWRQLRSLERQDRY